MLGRYMWHRIVSTCHIWKSNSFELHIVGCHSNHLPLFFFLRLLDTLVPSSEPREHPHRKLSGQGKRYQQTQRSTKEVFAHTLMFTWLDASVMSQFSAPVKTMQSQHGSVGIGMGVAMQDTSGTYSLQFFSHFLLCAASIDENCFSLSFLSMRDWGVCYGLK